MSQITVELFSPNFNTKITECNKKDEILHEFRPWRQQLYIGYQIIITQRMVSLKF